jgi:hypothetical protein
MKASLFKKEDGVGIAYLCKYTKQNKKEAGCRYIGTKTDKIIQSFLCNQLDTKDWKQVAEKTLPENVMRIFNTDLKDMKIMDEQFKKNRRKNGK